jgi:hypothetical protein
MDFGMDRPDHPEIEDEVAPRSVDRSRVVGMREMQFASLEWSK